MMGAFFFAMNVSAWRGVFAAMRACRLLQRCACLPMLPNTRTTDAHA